MTLFTRLSFNYLFSFFILLSFGCSKQSGGANNTNSEKTETKVGDRKVEAMDSTFIINYARSVPEFKEHEQLIRLFYRDRAFRLAWFKGDELVPQAEKFKEVISKAGEEGLNPKDYKLKDFDALYKNYQEEKNDSVKQRLQQELDIALTASYFHYGTDFYKGTVNPRETQGISWKVKRNKIKLNKALQTILKERESKYPYYEFAPLHPEYNNLKAALKRYRDLQKFGEWPTLEPVKKLQIKDTSPEVATIRKRLLMEYEPAKARTLQAQNDTVFDESLAVLVKKFQKLNGLKADGVIGPETIKYMNIPLSDRIDQLIINMERWRWIPKKFEDKYIFVNIPEYTMRVMEKGQEVLSMKVIVGKELNSTPIFSDKLEYIVFAPFWNVPKTIVEHEIKPNMLRNPNFLATQDMEIIKGDRKNFVRISPSSIDWANVTEKNFPYLIRQKPGPKNSLGLVKFLFPNVYNVYLHDTPFDALFNQEQRGFSHGCVRLEKPEALAEYLLKHDKAWSPSTIKDAMNAKEEQWVVLKEKVPVYIVYFTSWVDADGNVYFSKDLYGHDENLKKEYFG